MTLWRTAGLLVILGGLGSAIGAPVFTFGSAPVGSLFTIFGLLLEAAGIIVVAIAARTTPSARWATVLLLFSGIVLAIVAIASGLDAQLFDSTILLTVIGSVMVLIAAIGITATGRLRPVLRFAFLLPSIWGGVVVILLFAHLSGAWSLTIQGLLYIVAGVIFVASSRTVGTERAPVVELPAHVVK
jgi:hypothetical protein